MQIFTKKSVIKIPKEIHLLYDQKKNRLVLIGPQGTEFLVLPCKLSLKIKKHCVFIHQTTIKKICHKNTCGTTRAIIKQRLLELTVKLRSTLKLIGVGFKTYLHSIKNGHILQFKLGFSHFIFLRIPQDTQIITFKNIKLFVSNPSLQKLTHLCAIIRSLKYPEIYKGKGILYAQEKIILKKGKKIT
jgi:large subunit ribosomal protein L6